MKAHIELPLLTAAAAAFLSPTARAEPYCVDKSTSEVVAAENCEGDVDNFVTVDAPADTAVGDLLAKRDDTDETLRQQLKSVSDFKHKMDNLTYIFKVFGSCGDCEDGHSRGHGGAVGGGAVGRGGSSRGG